MLFCLLGESLRIGFKRTHPQVERSLRRDAFVAEFGKAVIEQIPILAIGIDITWLVDAAFYDGLEKNRCAHESKSAARSAYGRVNALGILHRRGHQHVANAFSRKAEGFRIRIADKRVFEELGHEGDFGFAVCYFAIRLVGNQIDCMAVFVLFTSQRVGKLHQVAFRVHGPRGVVGRIDDDAFCSGSNGVLDDLDVQLEIGNARGNLDA